MKHCWENCHVFPKQGCLVEEKKKKVYFLKIKRTKKSTFNRNTFSLENKYLFYRILLPQISELEFLSCHNFRAKQDFLSKNQQQHRFFFWRKICCQNVTSAPLTIFNNFFFRRTQNFLSILFQERNVSESRKIKFYENNFLLCVSKCLSSPFET